MSAYSDGDGRVIEVRDVSRDFTVRRGRGLRRTRSTVSAVSDLSFSVERGEMVGYIGPNGAGKSTTIKMLTGILVPTSGELTVAGLSPSRQRTEMALRIGVVFGQRTTLWWDLPLRDSFDLLHRIYQIPDERFRANLATFVDLLELGPLLDVPVRQLSLGQRMRGDIAAALLHDPEVVYLDEPTIGLDVVSKAQLRDFLRATNRERGITVLLTTHDLDDIERLCSRVMVIDRGRLVFDGPQESLHDVAGARRMLVVDLAEPEAPLAIDGAATEKVEGPRQWLSFPAEASAAPIIAAVTAMHQIADLSILEPSIEDVITRIYSGARDVGGTRPERAHLAHDADRHPRRSV
jgi:ABC-2 type transport system ATP-binding protein